MIDARSNSYIRMNQRKPFKVVVCAITLVAFFVNTFAYDLTWAGQSAPSELTSVGSEGAAGPGLSKELNVATFKLPDSLGMIRDSWSGKQAAGDKRSMTIIHIQDAHCNYASQSKVAEIVEYLNKEYGIDTINLEGGAREYDLSPFTDIKDKALRAKASDYFVKEGLVNGAEYFAVNNPEKVTLWGMEDPKLYVENLNIYRNSLKNKEAIDKYLKSLSSALSGLKTKIYSKELFEFDLKYGQYKAANLEFNEYLSYLIRKAGEMSVDINKFNDIYLLSKALDEEATIDFEKADNERGSLIDALQKKLSKRVLEELVVKTVDFESDKISQRDYYSYLASKAQTANVELKDLPELERYIAYISMDAAINKPNVAVELESLENTIRAGLCRTDEERKLSELSKNLALLKNIFGISISRQDYEYYKKNKDSFGVRMYISFITDKAPPYGIIAALDDNIRDLDKYREYMVGFYECSLKRDNAFLKNLHLNKSAVVITGGFHTENLAELFKNNGISYISILPNFRNEDGYVCNYYKILSGEKSLDLRAQLPSVLNATLAPASPLNRPITDAVNGKTPVVLEESAIPVAAPATSVPTGVAPSAPTPASLALGTASVRNKVGMEKIQNIARKIVERMSSHRVESFISDANPTAQSSYFMHASWINSRGLPTSISFTEEFKLTSAETEAVIKEARLIAEAAYIEEQRFFFNLLGPIDEQTDANILGGRFAEQIRAKTYDTATLYKAFRAVMKRLSLIRRLNYYVAQLKETPFNEALRSALQWTLANLSTLTPDRMEKLENMVQALEKYDLLDVKQKTVEVERDLRDALYGLDMLDLRTLYAPNPLTQFKILEAIGNPREFSRMIGGMEIREVIRLEGEQILIRTEYEGSKFEFMINKDMVVFRKGWNETMNFGTEYYLLPEEFRGSVLQKTSGYSSDGSLKKPDGKKVIIKGLLIKTEKSRKHFEQILSNYPLVRYLFLNTQRYFGEIDMANVWTMVDFDSSGRCGGSYDQNSKYLSGIVGTSVISPHEYAHFLFDIMGLDTDNEILDYFMEHHQQFLKALDESELYKGLLNKDPTQAVNEAFAYYLSSILVMDKRVIGLDGEHFIGYGDIKFFVRKGFLPQWMVSLIDESASIEDYYAKVIEYAKGHNGVLGETDILKNKLNERIAGVENVLKLKAADDISDKEVYQNKLSAIRTALVAADFDASKSMIDQVEAIASAIKNAITADIAKQLMLLTAVKSNASQAPAPVAANLAAEKTDVEAMKTEAIRLELAGASRERILKETGHWRLGTDMRLNIDFASMRLRPDAGKIILAKNSEGQQVILGDIIEDGWDGLLLVPELARVPIGIEPASEGPIKSWGAMVYKSKNGETVIAFNEAFVIRKDGSLSSVVWSDLVHELTHVVANIKGYAPAGNPYMEAKRGQRGRDAKVALVLRGIMRSDSISADDAANKLKAEWREDISQGAIDYARSEETDETLTERVKDAQISPKEERMRYRLLQDEAVARMQQFRLNMTPEQRDAESQYETLTRMLREDGLLKPNQLPEKVLIDLRGSAKPAAVAPAAAPVATSVAPQISFDEPNVSPFFKALLNDPEAGKFLSERLNINKIGVVRAGANGGNRMMGGYCTESGTYFDGARSITTYRVATTADAAADTVFHELLHALWRNLPSIREYWAMKGWGSIRTLDRGLADKELLGEEAFCDLLQWEMFADGGMDAKVSLEAEGERLSRNERNARLQELKRFFEDTMVMYPGLRQVADVLKSSAKSMPATAAAPALEALPPGMGGVGLNNKGPEGLLFGLLIIDQQTYPGIVETISKMDANQQAALLDMASRWVNEADRSILKTNVENAIAAAKQLTQTAATQPQTPPAPTVTVSAQDISEKELTPETMSKLLQDEVEKYNSINPDKQFVLRAKETSVFGYMRQSILNIWRMIRRAKFGVIPALGEMVMLFAQAPIPSAYPMIGKDGNLHGVMVFARPRTLAPVYVTAFIAMVTSLATIAWWAPIAFSLKHSPEILANMPVLKRLLVEALYFSSPQSLPVFGISLIGLLVVVSVFVYFRFFLDPKNAAMHEMLHAKQMFELYKSGVERNALKTATESMYGPELLLWEVEVGKYNRLPKTPDVFNAIGQRVKGRAESLMPLAPVPATPTSPSEETDSTSEVASKVLKNVFLEATRKGPVIAALKNAMNKGSPAAVQVVEELITEKKIRANDSTAMGETVSLIEAAALAGSKIALYELRDAFHDESLYAGTRVSCIRTIVNVGTPESKDVLRSILMDGSKAEGQDESLEKMTEFLRNRAALIISVLDKGYFQTPAETIVGIIKNRDTPLLDALAQASAVGEPGLARGLIYLEGANYRMCSEAIVILAHTVAIVKFANLNLNEFLNAYNEDYTNFAITGKMGAKQFLRNITARYTQYTTRALELMVGGMSADDRANLKLMTDRDPSLMPKLINLAGVYFRIISESPDTCAKIKESVKMLLTLKDEAALNNWLYTQSPWNAGTYETLIKKAGYSPALWKEGFRKTVPSGTGGVDPERRMKDQTWQLYEVAQANNVAGLPARSEGFLTYEEAEDFANKYLLENNKIRDEVIQQVKMILTETRKLKDALKGGNEQAVVTVEINQNFLMDAYSGVGVAGCFNPVSGVHREMPLMHSLETDSLFLRIYDEGGTMIANAILILTENGVVVQPLYESTGINIDLQGAVFDALAELVQKGMVPAVLMTSQSAGVVPAKEYLSDEKKDSPKSKILQDEYYFDFGAVDKFVTTNVLDKDKLKSYKPIEALTGVTKEEEARKKRNEGLAEAKKEAQKALFGLGFKNINFGPLLKQLDNVVFDMDEAGVRGVVDSLKNKDDSVITDDQRQAISAAIIGVKARYSEKMLGISAFAPAPIGVAPNGLSPVSATGGMLKDKRQAKDLLTLEDFPKRTPAHNAILNLEEVVSDIIKKGKENVVNGKEKSYGSSQIFKAEKDGYISIDWKTGKIALIPISEDNLRGVNFEHRGIFVEGQDVLGYRDKATYLKLPGTIVVVPHKEGTTYTINAQKLGADRNVYIDPEAIWFQGEMGEFEYGRTFIVTNGIPQSAVVSSRESDPSAITYGALLDARTALKKADAAKVSVAEKNKLDENIKTLEAQHSRNVLAQPAPLHALNTSPQTALAPVAFAPVEVEFGLVRNGPGDQDVAQMADIWIDEIDPLFKHKKEGSREERKANSAKSIANLIRSGKTRAFVARVGADVVGFVIADYNRDISFISYLAIRKDYQSGGIGTQLFKRALDSLKEVKGLSRIDVEDLSKPDPDGTSKIGPTGRMALKFGFKVVDDAESIAPGMPPTYRLKLSPAPPAVASLEYAAAGDFKEISDKSSDIVKGITVNTTKAGSIIIIHFFFRGEKIELPRKSTKSDIEKAITEKRVETENAIAENIREMEVARAKGAAWLKKADDFEWRMGEKYPGLIEYVLPNPKFTEEVVRIRNPQNPSEMIDRTIKKFLEEPEDSTTYLVKYKFVENISEIPIDTADDFMDQNIANATEDIVMNLLILGAKRPAVLRLLKSEKALSMYERLKLKWGLKKPEVLELLKANEELRMVVYLIFKARAEKDNNIILERLRYRLDPGSMENKNIREALEELRQDYPELYAVSPAAAKPETIQAAIKPIAAPVTTVIAIDTIGARTAAVTDAFKDANGRSTDVRIVQGVPLGSTASASTIANGVSRTLAKNGYGVYDGTMQIYTFEMDPNNAEKTREKMRDAVEKAGKGLASTGRVVIFAPNMDNGLNLTGEFEQGTNTTVLGDAYTDYDYPDMVARMALARNISYYYECSAKNDAVNMAETLKVINTVLALITQRNPQLGAIEDLFKFALRIKPVDYNKDIAFWKNAQLAAAVAV